MTNAILFILPGNENLGSSLAQALNLEVGDAVIRNFPDGEIYIKINSSVKLKRVMLLCSLDQPADKLLTLYFLSKTLKEFGVSHITLIAPYLAYMRQDIRFNEGESITSNLFAALVSSFIDKLVTIDPHLHRRSSLSEIYTIPAVVLHAAPLISKWIKDNVPGAVLVGPDMESEQWVSRVAEDAGIPYIVLEKKRLGDRNVEIKVPGVYGWEKYTPVLVDDIISTAKTMIVTTTQLMRNGFRPAVCIGVHGIFAGNSFFELLATGVDKILTTNSIQHASNRISVSGLIAEAITDHN